MKFRLLWKSNVETCNVPLHSFAHLIYEIVRKTPGGDAFWSTRPHEALQVQLARSRPLSPILAAAICQFFGIDHATWQIKDEDRFTEAIWRQLAAQGKLIVPSLFRSVWALSAFGREVELRIRAAYQPMIGLIEDAPVIPTFYSRTFVNVLVRVEFAAQLILVHISPERKLTLLAPSVFVPDTRLSVGVTELPTTVPRAGHPRAFAIHEPNGLHYLWALAVRTDVILSLPQSTNAARPRRLEAGEFDQIGVALGELPDRECFGVGVLLYEVVSL